MVYRNNTKEIEKRLIGINKIDNTYYQNCIYPINNFDNTPINKIVKENNTSINNTSLIKERKKEAKSYEDILSTFNLSDHLSKTIMDFVQMRNFIKKPMTNRGLELMIGKLQKMSNNESEQIEIVEQSIMNNWQGIFPLRKEEQKKDKRTNRFDSGSLDVINLEDYYSNL